MINIYLHYFKHKNQKRRNELDYCCKQNIKNQHVDKVFFLLETAGDMQPWMQSEKCVIFDASKRMNFEDMFDYSNSKTSNDDINIICNLDIFLDDTVLKIKDNIKNNHFLALTRWNIDLSTKKANLFLVNCSQDCWVWKGKVDLKKLDLNFDFGKPGCDNAICGEFHNAGYTVLNPSMEIKTYHMHTETTREYSDNDVVRKKLYLLYPTNNWTESKIQFWKDCTNFQPEIV